MKKIVTFLLLLILKTNSYAQIPELPKSALSPNAASLGLYGNIPVSLYTGTPDITIPLYDITVKDFVMPISLSYHTSGIRVDQHPGWTGLGWSLHAGGVITRSINDRIDEYDNFSSTASGYKAGYYHTKRTALNTDNWNQLGHLRSVAQSENRLGTDDKAPDEFSFNFAGYNGKFYLDHNGSWKVQCNKPVKVEFDGTFMDIPFESDGSKGYSPCFSGFTIVTENGTRYIFGGDKNAIDFSIDFFGQNYDEWIATAWYLTKIILPTQQEISFSYEERKYRNNEQKELNNQMGIHVYDNIKSEAMNSSGIHFECSDEYYFSIAASYKGRLISPAYLTEISTDNVNISFNKSLSHELKYSNEIYSLAFNYWWWYVFDGTGSPFLKYLCPNGTSVDLSVYLNNLRWYKLDSIIVKNKSKTETLKSIGFSYNDIPTERLALNSMTELGKAPYIFSYYNINQLPGYLANKSDHWGFYNNNYAPIECSSNYDYPGYYNYREPDTTYAKYGVLTKIEYPTGGYTEFEFEAHNYRKQLKEKRWEGCDSVPSNRFAGGVRIKRIKNSVSGEPASVMKEYFYVSDYLQNKNNASKSSGVLGGQIRYYFINYVVKAYNHNNAKKSKSIFSTNTVLPSCENGMGSHIGYTEVIEKNPDNSFTRYQFTNFDNGYLDEPAEVVIQETRTAYEPYASKVKERGQLLSQEDYNTNGYKVKSKKITYEKDKTENNYVRAMKASRGRLCPNSEVYYDEGSSYKIYTYLLQPQSETTVFYNPATGQALQSSTVNYTYTNKRLRELSVSASDNRVHKTSYKYPDDFSLQQPYGHMVRKNIINTIVEKETKIDNVSVQKELNNYTEWRTNVYKPIEYKISHKGGTPETRIQYHNYDYYGNPLYITKDGTDKTVYLWSYLGQHVIAMIKNASYDQVKNAIGYPPEYVSESTNPDINQIRTSLNSISSAHISTYSYYPALGMLTSTDPKGFTTYYTYDVYGRLKHTRNTKREILNSYEYHYQNQSESADTLVIDTSTPSYFPIVIDDIIIKSIFDRTQDYYQNEDIHAALRENKFSPSQITGGSGKFRYSWKSDGIYDLDKNWMGKQDEYVTSFAPNGNHTITLEVVDKETGEIVSKSKTINIKKRLIGFENVSTDGKYGTIYPFTHISVPILLLIEGDSNSKITLTVGGRDEYVYESSNNFSEYHTFQLEPGREIEVFIEGEGRIMIWSTENYDAKPPYHLPLN
ncbi:hypothetical protein [Viscerimonas tarda]